MTPPRALLVSLREPTDAMAHHERGCFAEAAGLPVGHIVVHPMIDGPLTQSHLHNIDAVFFGGSGAFSVLDDVPWIHAGRDALRRVVDARRPAWASCFGFQGLALALGGEVVRDDARQELGSTWLHLTDAGRADPLTGALPASFWGQEGHHDHVTRLPEGVLRLATGEVSPEQAFRVDGAPFWASQFHPELTVARTVDRFIYYRTHYFQGDPAAADALQAQLEAGEDTPGVRDLLRRLAWGTY